MNSRITYIFAVTAVLLAVSSGASVNTVERHSSLEQCEHEAWHCFWGNAVLWSGGCRGCQHHCNAITADVWGFSNDAIGLDVAECCRKHASSRWGALPGSEKGRCFGMIKHWDGMHNPQDWKNKFGKYPTDPARRTVDASAVAHASEMAPVSMKPQNTPQGSPLPDGCPAEGHTNYCRFGTQIGELIAIRDEARQAMATPSTATLVGYINRIEAIVNTEYPRLTIIQLGEYDSLNAQDQATFRYWRTRITQLRGVLRRRTLGDATAETRIFHGLIAILGDN